MNTLQTTLTALQSQLQSQKEASQYYYENVFSKEVATLEVSGSLNLQAKLTLFD